MLRLRGSNDAAGVGVPPGRVALGVESLRVKIPVRGTISTGKREKTRFPRGKKDLENEESKTDLTLFAGEMFKVQNWRIDSTVPSYVLLKPLAGHLPSRNQWTCVRCGTGTIHRDNHQS